MTRGVILTSGEADSLKRLGERLRAARLRRNLSQEEVAIRMGVTRKVLVGLEAGAPGVSVVALAKIMAVLGYPERLSLRPYLAGQQGAPFPLGSGAAVAEQGGNQCAARGSPGLL